MGYGLGETLQLQFGFPVSPLHHKVHKVTGDGS